MLIDKYPERLRRRSIAEIVAATGEQYALAEAARDSFGAQLFVDTATYGLAVWERALGIDVDISRPIEYRRTRIISKLRGSGTTTVLMIKNVAESFSNGQVEVIELPGEYRFEIKFVGTIGMPPNMEDLAAAVEDIKPAHLAYRFIIIYRTHEQLGGYTHAQLEAYTHEQLRQGGLKNG